MDPMSVLMTPDTANSSGNVHGGTILKLLDQVPMHVRHVARKPVAVNPLRPFTPDEKRRYAKALDRKEFRREMEKRAQR